MNGTTVINVKVADDTHAKFSMIAKEHDTPARTLGRMAIEKFIKDYEDGNLVITPTTISAPRKP